jgi:hypothetical protein
LDRLDNHLPRRLWIYAIEAANAEIMPAYRTGTASEPVRARNRRNRNGWNLE